MGYFSNGTECEIYEARYCCRCIHNKGEDGDGCMVMLAHLEFNYDECRNMNSILHLLIPRSMDKLGNDQCRMFIQTQEASNE